MLGSFSNIPPSEVTRQRPPGSAVSGFWLGYEAPQITDEIARAYGVPESLGDLARNQSVLVVAYRQ